MGKVARLLGTPFMPHQQLIADTAMEVNPATGRLVYREVRITVPRQAGKTTLLLVKNIHRMLRAAQFGGPQRLIYVAQTREKARQRLVDTWMPELKLVKPLRGQWRPRLSNGSESIRWKNGSIWGIDSTTEKAGHGDTLDIGDIDEAFSQVDARAEQAMRPTMLTRPQPQLWVISTAGTDASLFLRAKVDSGRQLAEEGVDEGICYFEWSAPDDADPADEAVWWACMPALGHTQPIESVRADYEAFSRDGKLAEFRRGYLNQWTSSITESVIPMAWWKARIDRSSRIVGRPVYAVDVSPDRSTASIVAAGRNANRLAHLELGEQHEGTDWVVPRLVQLQAQHDPLAIVLDDVGPAGSLLAPLKEAGVEVTRPGAKGLVQGCGALYDAARDGTIAHLGDPRLQTALTGAATRQLGDAWAWRRRTSSSDITPLVAATLALWGLMAAEAEDDITPLVLWG
ncbi:MAG TPA: terminase TerL endonuclease subunit [Nocardioides sp.]|nr:terminase TerL endonuclease subunit [Nocardioides sp.]